MIKIKIKIINRLQKDWLSHDLTRIHHLWIGVSVQCLPTFTNFSHGRALTQTEKAWHTYLSARSRQNSAGSLARSWKICDCEKRFRNSRSSSRLPYRKSPMQTRDAVWWGSSSNLSLISATFILIRLAMRFVSNGSCWLTRLARMAMQSPWTVSRCSSCVFMKLSMMWDSRYSLT